MEKVKRPREEPSFEIEFTPDESLFDAFLLLAPPDTDAVDGSEDQDD